MKKSLLEFYALSVCFVSVCFLSICLGIGAYNLVGVFYPEITMDSWVYEKNLSNDRFWDTESPFAVETGNPFDNSKNEASNPRPPEDVLTKKRLVAHKLAMEMEVRNSQQGVLRLAIGISIFIVLFIIHWRLAKAARAETNT